MKLVSCDILRDITTHSKDVESDINESTNECFTLSKV